MFRKTKRYGNKLERYRKRWNSTVKCWKVQKNWKRERRGQVLKIVRNLQKKHNRYGKKLEKYR